MFGPRHFVMGASAFFALSGLSFAADIPARVPPAPVYSKAPIQTSLWAGPYIGIHGGYGWTSSTLADNAFGLGSLTSDNNSGFGGVQIGYNQHLTPNVILGYEVDFSFGRIRANNALGGFPTTFDINNFGTARTRLGYATGPFLAYVTGGVAWAFTSFNLPAAPYSFDRAQVGWTIGAGLEYALSRNFSAKFEYLYADLDSSNGVIVSTRDLTMHMLRVGLNYRFGDISYAAAPAYPTKAPVAPFTWTGAYIGVHGGYSWSRYEATVAGVPAANLDFNGGFGGFQTGYNWQISPSIVVGIESDSSWGSIKGNALGVPIEINAMGTVRGRLGFAMDRALIYGTGGLAWANTAMVLVNDGYLIGWTAGAGIEYAFAQRWSAKVEYLYTDFGTNNETVLGLAIDEKMTAHTVKVGLNYRASLWDLVFGGR